MDRFYVMKTESGSFYEVEHKAFGSKWFLIAEGDKQEIKAVWGKGLEKLEGDVDLFLNKKIMFGDPIKKSSRVKSIYILYKTKG
tara:strand:+ start:1098 stop:1349 length:252 start_codon:yes stop_codon:yes gene_type:complete